MIASLVASWMLWALATGALVAVACLLLEQAARAAGVATRWVWVAGMLAMLGLGLAAALPRGWTPQDRPLVAAWALASAFLAGVATHAAFEGRRLRHGLEARTVAGTRVLVTDGIGPCAIGTRDPAVLMPRWALELDDVLVALVLRHEREHLLARDPLLLLVMLAAVVLVPWHLPLWWSWQRLRLAVEVDCDRRVLRGEADLRRYAHLLLLTGQRTSPTSWASRPVVTVVAPLRPHVSQLERRIIAMTERRTPRTPLRTALALVGAVAAVSLGAALPVPHRAAALAAPAPDRVTVRLFSLGLEGAERPPRILVWTTGRATVGIADDSLRMAPDTLRLDRLPVIRADITEGDLHIRLDGPGQIRVAGEIHGGPAKTIGGSSRYIVIPRGGSGIDVDPER